jgi:hypothetical protein
MNLRSLMIVFLTLSIFSTYVSAVQRDQLKVNQRVYYSLKYGAGIVTQIKPEVKIKFDSWNDEIMIPVADLELIEVSVDHAYFNSAEVRRGEKLEVPLIGAGIVEDIFSNGTLLLYFDQQRRYYFSTKDHRNKVAEKTYFPPLSQIEKSEGVTQKNDARLYAEKNGLPYAEYKVSDYKDSTDLVNMVMLELYSDSRVVVNIVYNRESSHDVFLEAADYLRRYSRIEFSSKVVIFETQLKGGESLGSIMIPTELPLCTSALGTKSKI